MSHFHATPKALKRCREHLFILSILARVKKPISTATKKIHAYPTNHFQMLSNFINCVFFPLQKTMRSSGSRRFERTSRRRCIDEHSSDCINAVNGIRRYR